MSLPAANRLLVRPAWAFPENAALVAEPDTGRLYVPPVSVAGPFPLTSPAIDWPILYHAGMARAIGLTTDDVSADMAFVGSGQQAGSSYTPAGLPRPWGRPGYLPRVPRTVVVDYNAAGSPSDMAAALADAVAAAGCSLLVTQLQNAQNSGNFANCTTPVLFWSPPNFDRGPAGSVGGGGSDGTLPTPQTSYPVPETTWMGGDVIAFNCQTSPYIQYFGYNLFASYVGVNKTNIDAFVAAQVALGYTTASFIQPIGPFNQPQLGVWLIDTPGLQAAQAYAPQVIARVNRFSGQFLFDPTLPPDNPGVPPGTNALAAGAYSADTMWGSIAGGLSQWTRQPVAGGVDPDPAVAVAAYATPIIAAIQQFWPS